METHARFALIGAVTLMSVLGAVAFLVWLAGVGPARETRAYDVVFDGVAGLDVDAEVVFSGLPVGRVTALVLHEPDPTRVRARIEILRETPIAQGTTAQLASQGVTGVSYVALSGGGGAPIAAEDGEVPMIPSVRSPVQALFDETPDVVAESAALLRELQGFATPENQARVTRILTDLEGATAAVRTLAETAAPAADRIADAADALAVASADLRDLSEPLGEATAAAEGAFDATSAAATRIDDALAATQADLLAALPGLAARADAALGLVETRLTELDGVADAAMGAIEAAEGAGRGIEAAAREDLPAMAREARAAATSLSSLSTDLAASLPRLVTRLERLAAGTEADLDRVGRAAADARDLFGTLERLARRIERNPTGFILRGTGR